VVLDQARGEYFKWAASDDLYGRELLERCVDVLDKCPDVVLAHSWTAAVNSAGNVTQAYKYPLATDSPSAPERFRSFMFGSSGLFEAEGSDGRRFIRIDNRGILRACDVYGVIRTDVLREVRRHDSYHHEDRIIVCELLFRGRFHQTPDWLYFRRDHDGRAYKTSLRARCVINDPRRANRFMHPAARLVAEYLLGYVTAIRRAPLSAADRRECYQILAQWIFDRATSSILPRHLEPFDQEVATIEGTGPVYAQAVVGHPEAVVSHPEDSHS